MLTPGPADLTAAPVLSLVPGVPLRSAPLCSRRVRFLSVLPTRGDANVSVLRLLRIDRPTRMFSELPAPSVGLRVVDLREADIDGVLLVIELPMREVRPEVPPTLAIRPELAAGCLAPVGVEGLCVPIESPILDPDVPRRDLERLSELAAGCLATVEADGLSIRIELLPRD